MNHPSTFLSVGSEETYSDDNIPPTVQITTPEEGYLYINLFNTQYKIRIHPLLATLIIGKIVIEIDAEDNVGIEWVKIYIEGDLKATITEPTYNWTWDEPTIIFPYTIRATASDYSENENSTEIKVWKFQLF